MSLFLVDLSPSTHQSPVEVCSSRTLVKFTALCSGKAGTLRTRDVNSQRICCGGRSTANAEMLYLGLYCGDVQEIAGFI